MPRGTLDCPDRGNRLGYPQVITLRDLFRARPMSAGFARS